MPEENHSRDFSHQAPLLIVISGPSGAGKDSVIKSLLETVLPLHRVVTATSRGPRKDEIPGYDYFFVTKQEFEGMIERGEMLEYSPVYQDYKGIPRNQVVQAFQQGKDVILRVDYQGAGKLRAMFPDALLIFIMPENPAELKQRLIDRESETEESLRVRLNTLAAELDSLPIFDYVVVNNRGHLDQAVDAIVSIIKAEHHRVHPRKVSL